MLSKTTIATIVVTFITIIVTNQFWLTFKPMSMNFDIKGKGKCNIEVQLNNKDDDKFNDIKSQSSILDLNKYTHASFKIRKAKFPKKIRLVITGLEDNSPVEISNITLENGKYKLDDLDKFYNSTGNIAIKNNSLIIYPSSSSINLKYKKTLQVRTAIKFDFKIFVIILVLTYMLAYKLANYIANFKTVKNKSRLDLIFLIIFFVFLFIPMCNINKDEISAQENRTLAKLQPFINQDREINYNFGKNFNEWFNDRFFLRDFFIMLSNYKFYFVKNWQTKSVIKGKDGWLFLGWKKAIDNYSNSTLYTDVELTKIANYLISINNYCNKHNKKFYFMIAPDKSKIYGEFYNDRIKKKSRQSKTEQLIKYINDNTDVKVIYPQDRLLLEKSKNERLLYYKTDTHWNLLGAYYGYLELIKNVKTDFLDIELYNPKNMKKEFYNGDLYDRTPKILRINDSYEYIIPDVKKSDICKETIPQEPVICNNVNGKYNLLMFRDSFSESLIPFLAHTFKKSKYIWGYNISPSEIENVDVIMLEIVERELPTLINNYME